MQRRICAVSWNRAVASFDTTYHHKLKSWNLSCSLKYKVLTFTSLSPYSLINATTSLPPPLSPSPPSLSHTHNILLNELLMLSVKLWIKLFTMLFVAPALAFYTLWLQSQHSCLMFSFTAPTSERWCVLHSFGIIITACLPLSSTVCTCEQQNSWLLLSIFLEQNMRSMCYTCMRYLVRVGGGRPGVWYEWIWPVKMAVLVFKIDFVLDHDGALPQHWQSAGRLSHEWSPFDHASPYGHKTRNATSGLTGGDDACCRHAGSASSAGLPIRLWLAEHEQSVSHDV